LTCSTDENAICRIAFIHFAASAANKNLRSTWDSLDCCAKKTRSFPLLDNIYIVGIFDFLGFGCSGFFLSTT